MSALLERHAPDATVCFGGPRPISALQFAGHVEHVASRLPGDGRPVVIACADRYAFSVALLASWVRGAVAVLPASHLPAAVRAVADRAGAELVLHDGDVREGDVRAALDVRPSLEAWGVGRLPIVLRRCAADPAVVAFTSGSTGAPQSHPKSLGQLLGEARTLVEGFELASARVVSGVPPSHLYGLLFGVLVPLVSGGALSRLSPLFPRELSRLSFEAQADVLVAVPPHLLAIAEDAACEWPRLRRIFCSGAPLPDATARVLAARGMPVTQVLGSTETGGIASRLDPSEPWRPLPRVRLGASSEGVLWVDSPWLAADQARPFYTQDRVALVAGGFEHRGRLDHVVKVGGRRVDLGDVEARLRSLPQVRDARVLCRNDGGARGVELLAVVEGEGLDARTLRRELTRQLDATALPRRFRFVASLPRTAAGKVSRHDLLSLFAHDAPP